MTDMTRDERIASARASGKYEPIRDRMQMLLDQGYTYAQIASVMFISRSTVNLAIATLELKVGRGRRELEANVQRATEMQAREYDLALVAVIRREYGIVGKGFATA